MTCRLLLIRDGASQIVDYWVAARADCIEYAGLWRFAGWWVWMEAWK